MYAQLRGARQAPLYDAVVLHYWMKIGESEFVVRLPTVLLATLCIAAVYRLGRHLFGPPAGTLSALLLSLAPLHVYYSREARMYTLASLSTTLALHFLWAALYRPTTTARWRYWAAYTLSAAGGLYTHYYTGFTFLAAGALLAVRTARRAEWTRLRSLVLAQLGVGVLFAPWLPTFAAQLESNPVKWIPALTWQRFSEILTRFIARPEFLGPGLPAVQLAAVLLLAAGLLAHIRARRLSQTSASWDAYLLIATAAIGPIAISVLVSMFKPFLVDRYLVASVPPACVLLSRAITHPRRNHPTMLMGIILIAGMAVSAYGVSTTRWRQDWRAVAAYVAHDSTPGDVIVLIPGRNLLPFNHYCRGALAGRIVSGNTANEHELEEALAAIDPFDRLWVVSQPNKMNPAVTAYLKSTYTLASCRAFGGVNGLDTCLYLDDTSGGD